MSETAASLTSQARRVSTLTAEQVARLAGISTSTVARIERGNIDPSFSDFEKILAACGWRYAGSLQPYIDMDAVRAARRIFEPKLGITPTVGSETYSARWKLAGISNAEDVAISASRNSSLSNRPGARPFGFMDWREVARSLRESGHRWALTGGYAASGYTKVATVDWAIFYVDDVEEAAAAAGLPPASDGRTWTTIIPFDDVAEAGVQTLGNGLCLASFWQIVIDCFAGNGRMPAQAEAMLEKVGVVDRR